MADNNNKLSLHIASKDIITLTTGFFDVGACRNKTMSCAPGVRAETQAPDGVTDNTSRVINRHIYYVVDTVVPDDVTDNSG